MPISIDGDGLTPVVRPGQARPVALVVAALALACAAVAVLLAAGLKRLAQPGYGRLGLVLRPSGALAWACRVTCASDRTRPGGLRLGGVPVALNGVPRPVWVIQHSNTSP